MEGIWAEAASIHVADIPARAMDFLTDLDSGWQIIAGGAICLLIFWRVIHERFTASAGHRALRRAYKKLAKAGVAEWERPYRLFAYRGDWNALPEGFLMELASRLMERDRVIEMILMAEEFDKAQQLRLVRLAQGADPESAMRDLSTFLTDVAAGLSAPKMIVALDLAVQIDPENHWALFDLATEHYAAKRFAKALPLLDQAIPLGQQAMSGLPREREARGRALAGRSPRLTMEKMQSLLKVAGEMYEDCTQKAGP